MGGPKASEDVLPASETGNFAPIWNCGTLPRVRVLHLIAVVPDRASSTSALDAVVVGPVVPVFPTVVDVTVVVVLVGLSNAALSLEPTVRSTTSNDPTKIAEAIKPIAHF